MAALPDYSGFDFAILHQGGSHSCAARLGQIRTPHGDIPTPNFIFCATKANLKAMPVADIRAAGADIILSNTYHLMLQPGADVVAAHGGLQEYSRWRGPMLTDSGGFQIFSLGHGSVADEIKGRRSGRGNMLHGINEDGAHFRSYVDGSSVFLSPERAIEVQQKLGADIILVLDECTPYHVSKSATRQSMQRSHRWALRSLAQFTQGIGHGVGVGSAGAQALYGIVQGGVYPEMRRESAEFVSEQAFFGTAIGGCLGGSSEEMYAVMDMSVRHLRRDRPIHLLGIGAVEDIWRGVALGMDTFDCVSPTRMARHGGAFMRVGHDPVSKGGRLNLRNAAHKFDRAVIDEACDCSTCQQGYSRGYLHHLLKAKEILGMHLISVHNVRFMVRLMRDIRQAIAEDNLIAAAKRYGVTLD